MAKAIKEIIIMLLICLISMLAFAVILYEYIPNRKVVAEVSTYSTSSETEALLADDIDSKENEVVLTYEVTSKDLSTYEITNEYVPGKSNPFEAYAEDVEEDTSNETTDNTTSDTDVENEDDSNNTTPTENNTETNLFIDDGGTK